MKTKSVHHVNCMFIYQSTIKINIIIIIFVFNTEPVDSSPFSLPLQIPFFPQEFKIAEFICVYNGLAKSRFPSFKKKTARVFSTITTELAKLHTVALCNHVVMHLH